MRTEEELQRMNLVKIVDKLRSGNSLHSSALAEFHRIAQRKLVELVERGELPFTDKVGEMDYPEIDRVVFGDEEFVAGVKAFYEDLSRLYQEFERRYQKYQDSEAERFLKKTY